MPVVVAVAKTILKFRAHVHIRPNPAAPRFICVGELVLPRAAFRPLCEESVLTIEDPWELEPGLRDVVGLEGFQHRLSSIGDPEEYYFIPMSYLLEVIRE